MSVDHNLSETNKRIVEDHYEALGAGDLDGLFDLLSEDIEWTTPASLGDMGSLGDGASPGPAAASLISPGDVGFGVAARGGPSSASALAGSSSSQSIEGRFMLLPAGIAYLKMGRFSRVPLRCAPVT